jgi:hypothetical protein
VSNGQGRHKTGQCSDDTANGKHCSSRLLRRRAAGEFKASAPGGGRKGFAELRCSIADGDFCCGVVGVAVNWGCGCAYDK